MVRQVCFERMTNKQAYTNILKEIECVKHREHCSKQCSHCGFKIDLKEMLQSLGFVKEILRSRDPELFFADTLTTLEEGLNNAVKI